MVVASFMTFASAIRASLLSVTVVGCSSASGYLVSHGPPQGDWALRVVRCEDAKMERDGVIAVNTVLVGAGGLRVAISVSHSDRQGTLLMLTKLMGPRSESISVSSLPFFLDDPTPPPPQEYHCSVLDGASEIVSSGGGWMTDWSNYSGHATLDCTNGLGGRIYGAVTFSSCPDEE